jgi:sterol desaturase/sphingolipid hydroxylase (fatty acid hydroxylase superfamily)
VNSAWSGAALAALTDGLAVFACLALLFGPLERAFPAVARQGVLRPALRLDLLFLAGQQLCFGGAVLAAVAWLHAHAQHLPLGSLRTGFGGQPLWLQVLEVVMLGDLLVYWGHRLQHAWEPLWRFHAVHHSAESLDWVAAHREHPLDGLYTQTLMNLPLIVTGFNLRGAAGVVVFRAVWAVFIHSNVRIPLGPLGWLFGSPDLHHWHHERAQRTVNYGNLAPWTDRLFGTHHCPPGPPPSLGLQTPLPDSYWRMLIDPLHPQSRLGERQASSASDDIRS